MKASDYLRKGFCKGNVAETATGKKCAATDPQAVAWCIMGAIAAATADLPRGYEEFLAQYVRVKELLVDIGGFPCIVSYNDSDERSQAEVVELLEKAGL